MYHVSCYKVATLLSSTRNTLFQRSQCCVQRVFIFYFLKIEFQRRGLLSLQNFLCLSWFSCSSRCVCVRSGLGIVFSLRSSHFRAVLGQRGSFLFFADSVFIIFSVAEKTELPFFFFFLCVCLCVFKPVVHGWQLCFCLSQRFNFLSVFFMINLSVSFKQPQATHIHPKKKKKISFFLCGRVIDW